MVPELAARQAQGIIMRRAPVLKLSCTLKFGTSFASYKLFLEVKGDCKVFIYNCQLFYQSHPCLAWVLRPTQCPPYRGVTSIDFSPHPIVRGV